MNRKQLTIGGVVIVFAALLTFAVTMAVVVWNRLAPSDAAGQPSTADFSGLPYCSDDEVKPCVVSFGVDGNDNMLVNLLVPASYPRFYLKITHNGTTNIYKCVRVRASLYSVYCIGEKAPPGISLHLMLMAEKDDIPLAEGDLPIIGLAFPNVDVVTSTPQPAGTEASTAQTPTEEPEETFDFILPTSTPIKPRPSTPTDPPSYPNPSYP